MIRTAAFNIDLLVPEDAAGLHALMLGNMQRFRRFFPKTLARNMSVEASVQYILNKTKEIRENSEFTFAIREKITRKVAGIIIIKDLDWNKRQGELAYCIGQQFGGRGWMTKAVKKLSDHAFSHLQLKTLRIIVHHSNKASVKVAQNCGFIWKKTLKKEYTPPHEPPLDMELYVLIS